MKYTPSKESEGRSYESRTNDNADTANEDEGGLTYCADMPAESEVNHQNPRHDSRCTDGYSRWPPPEYAPYR
jgi:hypothetical protein